MTMPGMDDEEAPQEQQGRKRKKDRIRDGLKGILGQ
jgi:hypothetical protein